MLAIVCHPASFLPALGDASGAILEPLTDAGPVLHAHRRAWLVASGPAAGPQQRQAAADQARGRCTPPPSAMEPTSGEAPSVGPRPRGDHHVTRP